MNSKFLFEMHDDMTDIAILTLVNDVLYMHIRLCWNTEFDVGFGIWKTFICLENVEKSVL